MMTPEKKKRLRELRKQLFDSIDKQYIDRGEVPPSVIVKQMSKDPNEVTKVFEDHFEVN